MCRTSKPKLHTTVIMLNSACPKRHGSVLMQVKAFDTPQVCA